MTSPIRIFISYAHKDGRTLALRLQESLSDLGYDIWLDTNKLQGGANWSRDIEQAIDNCHVVLALLSPASFESEICRAEHQRAVEKKRRIIPIMVLPCDRPLILQTLNYRDFTNLGAYDTSFSQLLDDLKNPDEYTAPPIKYIYNNAPPLPPHFIPRPDEYNKLKNALLSDTSDRQVALTALQGLGGIGKSVMANAVCKDDFLAGAFPDGVFWVELGREPGEIVDKLKTIGVALGDSDKNYTTLNDAIGNFRNIIAHKSALIVLDDVWEESYKVANYFIGTSPRTRWLVTTRNQAIVDELDATPVQLGMMHPDQAVALMREWAGKEDDQFATIAKRLGYHPLAVKIAGALLKDMSGKDWLEDYEITRLNVDWVGVDERHADIIACFDLSIKSLKKHPDLAHTLGIFPENKWIPESMVIRFWQKMNPDLDKFNCIQIIIKLAKLALIDRQADTTGIRMHDLLHDYNRYKIKNEYLQMQTTFIGALGAPYHLPHEYAWRYYAYHLIEAGQKKRLRELLLDYKFLDAKLQSTDVSALIDDCGLVLAHGKDEPIRLIQSALQMSSHVLDKDKKALAHQLAGRLMHYYTKVDEIHTFLDVVMRTPNNLFPLNPESEYDIMNPAGGMLLRTMKHENSSVRGAIQLRDGRILSWARSVGESEDNTLRLWDADGTPIATLTGHTDYVIGAVQLTNRRILSWSHDSTLRLWDKDGAPIAILTGHTSYVNGAMQLRDGQILSWSWDKTLRLWHADGTSIATLNEHTGSISGAMQLSSGQILSWAGGYFGSNDKSLCLWDEYGNMSATLKGHIGMVRGAIELRDGRILSWSNDKTLRLWDGDGNPIAILMGHADSINSAIQLRDGRILSWADSNDKSLRLWNEDGNISATLKGHIGMVRGAIELRDRRILSWSGYETLRLWEEDGKPTAIQSEYMENVDAIIQLPDGRLLLWGSGSTLYLWDTNVTLIAKLIGHTLNVDGAIQLHNGRILSWSEDRTLRIWDVDVTPVVILTGHSVVFGIIQLSNKRVLTWGADKNLCLWDANGNLIATLKGHTDSVVGAKQLLNGLILTWSIDSSLRLWDGDGNLIDMLEEPYWDGDRQIIGSWADKHGSIMDELYPPEEQDPISKYKLMLNTLYFPEEQNPIMAGEHVQVKGTNLTIYNPHTGALIHTFYGDAPFLGDVAVLDDGRMVVTGDSAGRVLFLRWVGEDGV